MSVDEIVKKIISDAEAKAAEIKAETDKQVKDLLKEAETKAEKHRAQLMEAARESLADRVERAQAMAQLEARKDLLARKRKHLEKVFTEAKERLNNLPEAKYAGLIEKQLRQIEVGESFEIIVRPEDVDRIGRSAAAIWNDPDKYKIVSDGRAIDGGFILRTGKFEYDNTFGSLLGALSESLEGKVTEILFGKGE
jgi:V/A-type H+-transporting ATPase subunit E